MDSDFEKKLHNLKPRGLTREEKSMLWSNVEESIHAEDLIKAHNKNSNGAFNIFLSSTKKVRMTIAALLTGSLIAGSFATVAYADNSRPGDFLFPVELASENIRLRLTSPDNRDELLVQFASERLEEVKELLALANISFEELSTARLKIDDSSEEEVLESDLSESGDIVTDSSTDIQEETVEPVSIAAFSDTADNDDGEGADDSLNTESEASLDSNDDVEDEDIDESATSPTYQSRAYDSEALERASNAFLIALDYLENSKDTLIDDGNDTAVLAIDAFIEELTYLADEHVEDIEKARIVINNNGLKESERVNIAIKASIDDVKTEFNFVEVTKSNGDSRKKIALDNGESEIELKVSPNRTVYEIDNTTHSDKDEKYKFEKREIKICYKDKSIVVDYSDLSKYLKKDASFGNCEDDEDDSDKKFYVCHKGDTLHVSYSSKRGHLGHGDSVGKCKDDDDDDNDNDNQDQVAPEIRDIESTEGKTWITVGWKTSDESTSKVWYSLTPDFVEGGSTPFVSSSLYKETHLLTINGLAASTTIYFKVESEDKAGNKAISDEYSAQTLAESVDIDVDPPIITGIAINPTTTRALVAWITDEPTVGTLRYSIDTPVTASDSTLSKDIQTFGSSHSVIIENLVPNSTYYYIIVAEDEYGNTSTSSEDSFETNPLPAPTDESAPIISNIEVSPTTTSATLSFLTDEDSSSELFYGIVSGNLDMNKSDTSFKKSHIYEITPLVEETDYFFMITVTDEEGNATSTIEQMFTTTSLPPMPLDISGPVISSVTETVGSSTVDISFETDEGATSKIYLSSSTPVDSLAEFSLSVDSYALSHDFSFSGLATNTKYHYILNAIDEAGNRSTSTEASFTTL